VKASFKLDDLTIDARQLGSNLGLAIVESLCASFDQRLKTRSAEAVGDGDMGEENFAALSVRVR
jgi:hypothetical protein